MIKYRPTTKAGMISCLMGGLALCQPASGGGGKIDASGNVTMNVYLIWDATDSEIEQVKDYFTSAAIRYYDAMEGRSRLDKICIYPKENTEGEKIADVKIPPKDHQYARSDLDPTGAWAFTGLMGKSAFINLPKAMVLSPSSDGYDVRTFVHEFGHYAYDLGDCYGGVVQEEGLLFGYNDIPIPSPSNPPPSWDMFNYREYMIEDAFLRSMLLDYDSKNTKLAPWDDIIYGRGGGPTFTDEDRDCSVMDANGFEFSTPTSVVGSYLLQMKFPKYRYSSSILGFGVEKTRSADSELTDYRVMTQHWKRHGKSEWEVIRDNYSQIGIPSGTLSQQTLDVADYPEFCVIGGFDVAVCIDRSGSMSGSAIEQAKSGAKSVISALADEDDSRALISSFASSGSVDFALAEVEANRAGLNAAIDGISSGGSTNIGDGLVKSVNGLGTGEESKFIVLLSDGEHNTGTHPSQVDLSGVTVYPIAYGNADLGELRDIADASGGELLAVSGNNVGNAFLKQLKSILSERNAVESAPVEMRIGDSLSHSLQVTPGSSQVTISAAFDPGDIRFVAQSPSGQKYDFRSPFYRDNGHSKLLNIPDPEPGKWKVVLKRTRDARAGAWGSKRGTRIYDNTTVTNVIRIGSSGIVNNPTVTVNLRHTYRGDLNLTLISPQGTRVRLKQTNPDDYFDHIIGTFGVDFTPVDSLSILEGEPLAGDWTLEIEDAFTGDEGVLKKWVVRNSARYANFTEEVTVDAFVDDTEVFFDAKAVQSSVAFPEPIKIEATVSGGFPITGATVTATVSMPDGGGRMVQVYDDGSELNGDQQAFDGVYSAFFDRYGGGNGIYEFSVKAVVGKSAFFNHDISHNVVEEDAVRRLVRPPKFEASTRFQVDVTGVPVFETEVVTVDRFSSNIKGNNMDKINFSGKFTSSSASSMGYYGGSQDVTVGFGQTGFIFPASSWVKVGRKPKYIARYSNGRAVFNYNIGGSSKNTYSLQFGKLNLVGIYGNNLDSVPVSVQVGSYFDDSVNIVLDESGSVQRFAGQTSGPEFFVNTLQVVNSPKPRRDSVVLAAKVTGVSFDPSVNGIRVAAGPYVLNLDPSQFKAKGTKVYFKRRFGDGSSVNFVYDYGKGVLKLRAGGLTIDEISDSDETPVSLTLDGVGGADWRYKVGMNSNWKNTKFRY